MPDTSVGNPWNSVEREKGSRIWNAEDNTSAEIMTQFYQNLKNGMTKSEAMQKAKLSQIKSHPFFWSPFILIGAAN